MKRDDMVYDVYKYLVENEETILNDLSMLKYIKADLDSVVSSYLDTLIRDAMSSATAEDQMLVIQHHTIQDFIYNTKDTLRRGLYGNKDTLH